MSITIKDAGLIFNGTLKTRSTTNKIVVHHSDAAGTKTVKEIHQIHLAKGWAGIGYHYYIPSDGAIWRGRPEGKIGAHAYQDAKHEANSNGIGICLGGDFTSAQPTSAQLASLVALIKDIGTRYSGMSVVRHSDVMATACPGASFPWTTLKASLNSTTDNTAYFNALTTLVKDSVISSPDYWRNAVTSNTPVNGEYMAIAIKKITNKSDLKTAVAALVSAGVVSSPDYWLSNCVAGKTCNPAYVKVLIINGVAKLKL